MQEVQLIDSRKCAVPAIDEKGNVPIIFGPKVSNCLVSCIVSDYNYILINIKVTYVNYSIFNYSMCHLRANISHHSSLKHSVFHENKPSAIKSN